MSNYTATQAAFYSVCGEDVVTAQASYVSLYVSIPFYGGPEEGGWWGNDTELVAYHKCSNAIEAERISERIQELAGALSKDANAAFNTACAKECEWLEARGLDSDFLPEVDGPLRYWVAVEERPGTLVSEGDRCYS